MLTGVDYRRLKKAKRIIIAISITVIIGSIYLAKTVYDDTFNRNLHIYHYQQTLPNKTLYKLI